MPVPLIELQRRLSLVGQIRAGGEKPERGVGRKLEEWRITSARRELIDQAAELYGGEVSGWESPTGPAWQVYTAVSELPVLLMPDYSLKRTYELWEGATKRTRLCDGIDEELSGGPCICNAEGIDKCDLYTRLIVALPELDTMLGWRLISRGANVAHELPTMVAAARSISDAPFVPARLHLEQRRGVVNGQVTRFVVPTLDLGVGYARLAAEIEPQSIRAELMPVPDRPGATVEDALDSVASDRPAPPGPRRRQAAEFGPSTVETSTTQAHEPPPDDVPEVPQVKVPEVPPVDVPEVPPVDVPEVPQTFAATEDQKKKLNILVAHLVKDGVLTKDGLYDAVATRLRNVGGLELALALDAYDDEHEIHWSPLRDDLTRPEATQLIDWLTKAETREAKARAAAGEQAAPEPQNEETGDEPVSQPPGTEEEAEPLRRLSIPDFPDQPSRR